MPRTSRADIGGLCYHVLNRGNRKASVFNKTADYRAFLNLMTEALSERPVRLLAYCLMPNHFHFVLWPRSDGDLGRFMHWLLTTHVRRHHRHYGSDGRIWQGRFKAFPIQRDHHLLTALRYVERNPLRAGLVPRAERWCWSSLSARTAERVDVAPPLTPPPVPLAHSWIEWVNSPQTNAELTALREAAQRERPFGEPWWVDHTAWELGLGAPKRCGRPAPR